MYNWNRKNDDNNKTITRTKTTKIASRKLSITINDQSNKQNGTIDYCPPS